MARMKLTVPPDDDLASKLRNARLAMKLTTREVAACLAGDIKISHATIANYENNRGQPTLALLSLLAKVYRLPVERFLERSAPLTGVCYRSQKSKISQLDRTTYEAQALRWLEAYVRIERRLGETLKADAERPKRPPGASPAEFAALVRARLGIAANSPVVSVVTAMERFGIRVIEVESPEGIDGLAAKFGEEDVVVLNPGYANDRMRMNESHEFFHPLLGHCGGAPNSENEDEAFTCGRYFLLPPDQLREAFARESFLTLLKFKETFGISLAAMIYAAERDGHLPPKKAKFLWIELSRRGWRVKEPGYVRPDRATRFEQMLDGAVNRGVINWKEAALVSGIPEEELQTRVEKAMEVSVEKVPPKTVREGGEPTLNGLRLAK